MQVKGLECATFNAYQTPSSRRLGWEAFTLGYVSELEVQLLHRVMLVLLPCN
jgi:hypothetical protein